MEKLMLLMMMVGACMASGVFAPASEVQESANCYNELVGNMPFIKSHNVEQLASLPFKNSTAQLLQLHASLQTASCKKTTRPKFVEFLSQQVQNLNVQYCKCIEKLFDYVFFSDAFSLLMKDEEARGSKLVLKTIQLLNGMLEVKTECEPFK